MKDSIVYMASYDLLDSLGTVFQLSVKYKERIHDVEERDFIRLTNRYKTDEIHYEKWHEIIEEMMLYIKAHNYYYKKNDYMIQYDHLNNLGISLKRFFRMAKIELLSFLEFYGKDLEDGIDSHV